MLEGIADLREERSHLVRTAKDIKDEALAQNRVLTQDEKVKIKDLLAEADKISEKIEAIRENEKFVKLVEETFDDLNAVETNRQAQPQPTNDPKAPGDAKPIYATARYSKLSAYKGQDAAENAYKAGMWLLATLAPAQHPMKTKAHRFCQDKGIYHQIQNALSTGVPASGGNLVPDVMSQTIIDLREEYGIARQWADVMPMSSDHQIVPVQSSILTATFTGENVALTESESTWSNITLTAKKMGVMTRMSTEVSEDAIVNMADRITRDMAYAFALKEDQVFFNGTGISTDGNITGLTTKIEDGNYIGFYEPSATCDTFAEVTDALISKFIAKLPQYAHNGAAFFCGAAAAAEIFGRLLSAAGGNTQTELASGNLKLGVAGVVGAYKGYPVVASQVLPNSDSTPIDNDTMFLFGNLRLSSMIGERRAFTVASSDQRYWDQDQIAIKATSRLDINHHSLGDSTTYGPVLSFKGSTS